LPAPSPSEDAPPRRIAIEAFGRAAVVALPGDLDQLDDDHLAEAIDHAIRCGHHHLVLDFTETTYLDSRSYRAIIHALGALHRCQNSAVVLAGARGLAERLLRVLEADLVFTVFATRGDALRALRDPSRPPNDGWRTIPPPGLVPPGRERTVEPEPTPSSFAARPQLDHEARVLATRRWCAPIPS
jgi:anti-anti-sigma factor